MRRRKRGQEKGEEEQEEEEDDEDDEDDDEGNRSLLSLAYDTTLGTILLTGQTSLTALLW